MSARPGKADFSHQRLFAVPPSVVLDGANVMNVRINEILGKLIRTKT